MFRVDTTEVKGTMPEEQLQLEIEEAHSKIMHSPKAIIEFRILQRQDAANASSREWNGFRSRAVVDDVDKAPIQDLALNEDNIFQADQCDAFDSDVDEAHIAQTMFMANL
ncbi:hypothetical protein Tco_0676085, partial [Tanacetum coccineum]